MKKRVDQYMAGFRRAFGNPLRRSIARGELPDDTNVFAIADALEASVLGLFVLARGGATACPAEHNINSIAMAYGNFDEPSGRELLTECNDLICSSMQSVCPGSTFDFCASQDTSRCLYRINDREIPCGDCSDATSVQACADRAANELISRCRS